MKHSLHLAGTLATGPGLIHTSLDSRQPQKMSPICPTPLQKDKCQAKCLYVGNPYGLQCSAGFAMAETLTQGEAHGMGDCK